MTSIHISIDNKENVRDWASCVLMPEHYVIFFFFLYFFYFITLLLTFCGETTPRRKWQLFGQSAYIGCDLVNMVVA